MIDPMVALAHSMYTNRGVYALLLGSGISRSAGVPTGWEVVLNLIERIAKLENADTAGDPAGWFTKIKGTAPDYSLLVDTLAKTPAERRELLQGYFEPTEDEREQSLKLPTPAHRAIAKLVAMGCIRVIITTNFDRLMEIALREEGIEPTVVSTVDGIAGAPPLVHLRCLVLKIHGDYLDTRLRNTIGELSAYEPEFERYLDRIFDEFGLIVCGWSGEWDPALRAAIERCSTRRYTTWWTVFGEPSGRTRDLMTLRRAEVLRITGADKFFTDLTEKIFSLSESNQAHPLTPRLAVATLKRHLEKSEHRIRVHDLVTDEVRRVLTELRASDLSAHAPWSPEEFKRRIECYEIFTAVLRHLAVTGARWNDGRYDNLWAEVIVALAKGQGDGSGLDVYLDLQLYPAVLIFYCLGLGAMRSGDYSLLRTIVANTNIPKQHTQKEAHEVLPASIAVDINVARTLPGLERRRTPLSDHLVDLLFQEHPELALDREAFENLFDRFEIMVAMIHIDRTADDLTGQHFAPVGRFSWRNRSGSETTVTRVLFAEAAAAGAKWAPLHVGLFRGSTERFAAVRTAFEGFLGRLPRY